MKKILFLGAATFQVPPIEYALSKGYYVITCDNRPDNPGHKLAHKNYNVSTLDKAGVLEIAMAENINGVLTYGSDVSALTVAFVAEKMNLPGNSYDTILTLTNKKCFRDFLTETGLQTFQYRAFDESERKEIFVYLRSLRLPVILKPVDSSGSKGASILRDLKNVEGAVNYAFNESRSREIIVETYVEKQGKQICGDGYMEDGKLVFVEFGDGHYYNDTNFLAPYAETFPSAHELPCLDKVKATLEKILLSAGFTKGVFNLDVIISDKGEPFVIEIGPRSGGNFIPKALLYQTNVDLISAAVESSLDASFKLDTSTKTNGSYYACYMLHSKTAGVLSDINYPKTLSQNIVEKNIYLSPGSNIEPFHKASEAVGNLILRFKTFEEMQAKIKDINNLNSIVLKS